MKKFVITYLMLLPAFIGSIWGAVPTIANFSSTGGNPTNKDNDHDIMYLVSQGDALIFSVTADQPVSFEWAVNKSTEAGQVVIITALSDTFNWMVPNEKGIWEIHLKVWNASNEETHKEWVVSTLTFSEAPEFFEYFTDSKFSGTRTDKDLWNRALPVWTNNANLSASRAYLRGIVDGVGDGWWTRTPSSITFGTYRFRYRYPDGNTGQWGCGFLTGGSISWFIFSYTKLSDTHHHCSVLSPRPSRPWDSGFSIDYDGGGWPEDGKWRQITIIRTTDTWVYTYVDDVYEFQAQDHLPPAYTVNTLALLTERNAGHEVYMDNIEVYKDKFIYPNKKEIKYDQYIWNYWMSDHTHYPERRPGIVVKGRGVTLEDIANAVGATYLEKSGANTYICKTDLVFDLGCEFKMNNEILKFRSSFDGERHLAIKYGAKISINNSLITSENDYYYVWNNAGSTTHLAVIGGQLLNGYAERIYSAFPINHSGYLNLSINNSTIDKASHMFFDSPYDLKITNTKFTNLSEIDIGDYTGAVTGWDEAERIWYKGNKSFRIATDELNVNNFDLSNISISGKTSPLNVTFQINAIRDKLNIYNVDLQNENIVLIKPACQIGNQSLTWGWFAVHAIAYDGYGGQWDGLDCKLGLVNCRFKSLNIEQPVCLFRTIPADRTFGIPKYYLDVKVIDNLGAVSSANVTVTNEVDNTNYPSENIAEKQDWFDPPAYPGPWGGGGSFYLQRYIIQGSTFSSTITAADGHTPLPANKAETLVIADYVKSNTGVTNFTYKITAAKDGKTASISGLNIDESWYREDSSIPTKTVVCNIDTGLGYVEAINTGIISGTVKDLANNPISGATVSAGTRQATTNVTGSYAINVLAGTYTVTAAKTGYQSSSQSVTVTPGTNATINFVLTPISSEIRKGDIGVYPNPYVKGKSSSEKITFANLDQGDAIKVYNMNGELMKELSVGLDGKADWNVANVASGIYLYVVTSSEGTRKGKLSIIK